MSSRPVTKAESFHWTGVAGLATLTGLVTISPSNIWTIGSSIEHWNGSTWSVYEPVRGAKDQQLNAIAAVSPSDIWVVGGDDGELGSPGRLVDHWNGRVWTKVQLPKSDALNAVGIAPNHHVWAAGGIAAGDGDDEGYVVHWNGERWVGVVPPVDARFPNQLFGIAPVSPADVLVVGFNGYAAKWNGKSWVTLADANGENAITALSAANAWSVGSGVEHWNGTNWTPWPFTLPAGWYPSFASVSATSASDIWAAGSMYQLDKARHIVNSRSLVAHWNGLRWTRDPNLPAPAGFSELTGVSALATGDAWAVGSYVDAKEKMLRPLLEHYVSC